MDRLLNKPEEAAEGLGIGRTKVFELMKSGELASVRIGRARLIPTDSLVDYVDRLKAEQAPAA